ncbi:P-loop containing nucleoside triphosphate hydrolases superfamily protein [Artemisia annua]|uniref:P-loop containing nucleoside triphosphate hydrolases superfamily protein n=1 Tax=Artemisia annua TaxID=35608 RepID=A0A2U1QFP8_ARTAN|nr:P-loop containing nucleoside triphosphate hydrolases superfamily protein [Artemisia annua]
MPQSKSNQTSNIKVEVVVGGSQGSRHIRFGAPGSYVIPTLHQTPKKRFDLVTQHLKVTTTFSAMVKELEVIGTNTPKNGDTVDAFTEVMGAMADCDRSPILLFMGGGMGTGKIIVLK